MLATSIAALLVAGAGAVPCENLRSLATAQAAITNVDVVPAGVFVQPGGRGGAPPAGAPAPAPQPIPEHCRVRLVLKPTTDSNINSELWLPTENWNGKLLVVGNGGFAGSIQGYGDMQTALRLGYATAATDTGHSAADRQHSVVETVVARGLGLGVGGWGLGVRGWAAWGLAGLSPLDP